MCSYTMKSSKWVFSFYLYTFEEFKIIRVGFIVNKSISLSMAIWDDYILKLSPPNGCSYFS